MMAVGMMGWNVLNHFRKRVRGGLVVHRSISLNLMNGAANSTYSACDGMMAHATGQPAPVTVSLTIRV